MNEKWNSCKLEDKNNIFALILLKEIWMNSKQYCQDCKQISEIKKVKCFLEGFYIN